MTPTTTEQIYCLKCETEVDAHVTAEQATKNRRRLPLGSCPTGHTKTTKITCQPRLAGPVAARREPGSPVAATETR